MDYFTAFYYSANVGQITQEQHIQAMTLLESVQALERQKMQLDFQLQQITLGLQQVEAAHVMQKQFQETLKLQQQQPPKAQPKMKLALRKRLGCCLTVHGIDLLPL